MPYDQMSDESLLEHIGRRDRAALAAVYDRYAPRVMAVAARATGERAAAEAAVEQLFWSLWRGELTLTARGLGNSLMVGVRRLAEASLQAAVC